MLQDAVTALQRILVETGSAAFAAAVGSLVTLSWTRTRLAIKFRRLRSAFGRRVSSHHDIAISVPLWIALENSRLSVRFAKRDFEGAEEVYYGPDEMFNRNDMLAAASVINLFGDFFSKPVLYVNDRDEPVWTNRAVVVVGAPAANFHSRRLLEVIATDPKYACLPRFIDMPEDDVTGAKSKISVPSLSIELTSNQKTDYGLILRIENPYSVKGSYFIYIVAGIHADSTQEAGRILRENWADFCGKGSAKALVFEMDRHLQFTGRIIHRIGLR